MCPQGANVAGTRLERADSTRWTRQSGGLGSGWSGTAAWVSYPRRAFGLRPHRTETFSLSRDPQLIEKVCDAVRLRVRDEGGITGGMLRGGGVRQGR